MHPWNEAHYARAQEFITLLADTIASAVAETPDLTAAPFARPSATAAPAAPATGSAPVATPPPAPTPAAPSAVAAPATAAGLFKKMPWKK